MATNPIERFIDVHQTSPLLREALQHSLQEPFDSEGNPRELNRTTLGELAGVDYTIVHRTELALYEKIPPTLLKYMQSMSKDYYDWPKMYREWREFSIARSILAQKNLARVSTRHWTLEAPDDVLTAPIITFRQWRERHFDSVMNMAKVILVNPTIIANYENGKTKNLPVGVQKQFRRFGMSEAVLKQVMALKNR